VFLGRSGDVVGRLLNEGLPWSRELGLLWEEIRDGTLVFHEPTPEQKAVERARRTELFRASSVPWILTDLSGLLGAYDDAQDVLAFANWNRKVYSPGAFRDCIEGQTLRGNGGMAAAVSCACPFGRGSKRHVASAGAGWGSLLTAALFGVPVAAALAFLPAVPAVMWGLLAGQVALSVFGVGLRLGPIVAASQELTYRTLGELGFPFGVDHNKYNQLKRNSLLQYGDRMLGAGAVLRTGDRLTATMALSMAYRDVHPAPEVVIPPEAYPRAGNLLRDPWGTIRAAASLASSLLPNAAAYVANDMVAPGLDGMAKLMGGTVPPEPVEPSPQMRSAMRAIHNAKCPRSDACLTGVADYLKFLQLLGGLQGDGFTSRRVQKADGTWETVYSFTGPEVERISLGVDNTIWGGLFRPVTAF
jgi:hypothetical protein